MSQIATIAEGVSKTVQAGETVNRAVEKVKECLHSVKVSQRDATKVQREMEGELFDKWHEAFEVMESKGVAFADIDGFLDHLRDAYDGIDDVMRMKMDGIKFPSVWSNKIWEFKKNSASDSGAKYGMIAFGKSPDGKFVDCMYCLYKLDFKVAPQRIVIKKQHSVLLGLIKWETTEEKVQERVLGVKLLKNIKNYFRYKALEGFYSEGLIDRMNFVASTEDVDYEL